MSFHETTLFKVTTTSLKYAVTLSVPSSKYSLTQILKIGPGKYFSHAYISLYLPYMDLKTLMLLRLR